MTMRSSASSVGQCSQYGIAAILFGTGDIIDIIIAQQLIKKKGPRRHDVRSLLPASPFLLTGTQFTRTIQLTFYGGATALPLHNASFRGCISRYLAAHIAFLPGILSLRWS